jgi:competence protein ComEC
VTDKNSGVGVLVDCPSAQDAVFAVLDQIAASRVKLSAVIVSHWDLDHYGGIARVATEVKPDIIYYNHDTLFEDGQRGKFIRTTLKQFLDLHSTGSELHHIRAGDAFTTGGISVEFLAPTHAEVTAAYVAHHRNVASCVVSLRIGAMKVLIGGDAVGSTWRRLLNDGADVGADILRWPHHGAELHGDNQEGSLTTEVIARVNPSQLFVSAGSTNRYGHPAASVIKAATVGGCRVMCTQVTPGCFGDEDREARLESLNAGWAPGRKATPCAGTIRATEGEHAVVLIPEPGTHDNTVDSWPSPMCRSISPKASDVAGPDPR